MFKILCLDGGGVRGIYPAYILQRIENDYNAKIIDIFDMVVGTSTGAIIAGAIAADYPITDIVKIFENKSEQIFKKIPFSFKGFIKSRYDKESLTDILGLSLGTKKLDEAKIKLIITATDIGNGKTHIFKSYPSPELSRDAEATIAEAILSSCSAPTYFDPETIGEAEYKLADGGLWANNPSLLALIEALQLSHNLEEIKIFSIGTGTNNITYNISTIAGKKWGLIKNWKGKKLIDMVFNLQSMCDADRSEILLGKNYLRINSETDEKISLDDYKIVEELKNRADFSYTSNSETIKQFLEIEHITDTVSGNILLDKETHIIELFETKMVCTYAFFLKNISDAPIRFVLTDYDGSYRKETLNIEYQVAGRTILNKAKVNALINNNKAEFVEIEDDSGGGKLFVAEWSVEVLEPLLPNEEITFYRENEYLGHVIAQSGEVSFRPRVPCNKLIIIIQGKENIQFKIDNVFQSAADGKQSAVSYQKGSIIPRDYEQISILNTKPNYRYVIKISRK